MGLEQLAVEKSRAFPGNLEITEILKILEVQAKICLNVSRMMQGVIGAISRGGFGGRNPLIVNHFSLLCLGSYGYNDTDLPPVSTPFHLY